MRERERQGGGCIGTGRDLPPTYREMRVFGPQEFVKARPMGDFGQDGRRNAGDVDLMKGITTDTLSNALICRHAAMMNNDTTKTLRQAYDDIYKTEQKSIKK